MNNAQVNTIFQELVADTKLMHKIGLNKRTIYNYRNPEKQTTTLGKKLEILYKCGRLQLK